MSWLDGILGRIFDNGAEVPLAGGLNFAGGLRAGLNPVSKIVEVVLGDNSVSAAEAAPEANGAAVPVLLTIPFFAGTPGTADDVTLFEAAPFAFRIIDSWAKFSLVIGGSSVRVRSASGGGGSALTGTFSSAAVGTVRETTTVSPAVALGSGVYLRRSNRGVTGEVFLLAVKT